MSLTIERFVTTGFAWSRPAPSSQKNYRNHVTQFEAFLKGINKSASDGNVTDQDILDFLEYIKSKYHPNSVTSKMTVVKSYFRWLVKEGILASLPRIQSQPKIKAQHKELCSSDLDIMIKNMEGDKLNKQRDLAMFSLIVYCGFKTKEVVTMNVEDTNLITAKMTLTKNHRYTIGIRTETYSFLAALPEVRAYANAKKQNNIYWTPLFSTNDKEPFFLNKHRLRISGRSLRRRLMTCLETPKSFSMRDLRYTYLKNLDRVKAESK